MAHADRKHFGKATQGKGTGAGAMTELDKGSIEENKILSNRDKKQHSKERGQDGAARIGTAWVPRRHGALAPGWCGTARIRSHDDARHDG